MCWNWRERQKGSDKRRVVKNHPGGGRRASFGQRVLTGREWGRGEFYFFAFPFHPPLTVPQVLSGAEFVWTATASTGHGGTGGDSWICADHFSRENALGRGKSKEGEKTKDKDGPLGAGVGGGRRGQRQKGRRRRDDDGSGRLPCRRASCRPQLSQKLESRRGPRPPAPTRLRWGIAPVSTRCIRRAGRRSSRSLCPVTEQPPQREAVLLTRMLLAPTAPWQVDLLWPSNTHITDAALFCG